MGKSIATGGAQNDGYVGDIITSALTEAQFQAQRNGTWVLMDGRSVVGSRYQALTSQANIPDGRGLFLRGKNNGRVDGLQNPAGEVAIGTYQADDNKAHTHTTSGGGGGSATTYVDQNVVGGANQLVGTNNTAPAGSYTFPGGAVTVNSSGGVDSRPRNITVNYFIKIN